MAGIMDLFKTSTPPSQNNQPAPTPPAGKENLSANPPIVGNDGNIPGTAPAAENPLDVYNKMFDNANSGTDLQAPSFKIDPKVLSDVSGKMDFTKGINPDTVQKATSGDVGALMEIIKTVGQNSYRASLEHGTALTDTFMNSRSEYETKKLEKGVHSQLTSSALSSAPNYNHPVVKQELNRIAEQFSRANPDASPQEVAKAAQKYISDLQSALNPADPTKNNDGSNKTAETDWTQYLNNSPD